MIKATRLAYEFSTVVMCHWKRDMQICHYDKLACFSTNEDSCAFSESIVWPCLWSATLSLQLVQRTRPLLKEGCHTTAYHQVFQWLTYLGATFCTHHGQLSKCWFKWVALCCGGLRWLIKSMTKPTHNLNQLYAASPHIWNPILYDFGTY